MKKYQSTENLTKTYTCWLSVSCTLPGQTLPPGTTEDHVEEFLKKKSRENGEFHSLKLSFNEKYKKYQCFINFLSEKSANRAVDFFNRIDLGNLKLKLEAKFRQPEKTNDQNINPLLESDSKFKSKSDLNSESLRSEKKNPLLTLSRNDKNSKFSINHEQSERATTDSKSLSRNRKDSRPISQQEVTRYIVIDGNNVAINHGREKVFSSQGIKITVDYFKRRGLTDIVAIVPEFRRTNLKGEFPTKNPEILEELYENKHIMFTPSMCYDDGFILEYAKIKDAIIVSNDRYRDLIFTEKYAEQTRRKYGMGGGLVPFSIFDDVFLPANDPYGRNGPTLDQMLSSSNSSSNMRSTLTGNDPCFKGKTIVQEKAKKDKNEISNNSSNKSKGSNKKFEPAKLTLKDDDSSNLTEFKTKLKGNRNLKGLLESLNNSANKNSAKNLETKSKKDSKLQNKDPYSIFDEEGDNFIKSVKSVNVDDSSDEDTDEMAYFDSDDDVDGNETKLNDNEDKDEDDVEFPYQDSVILKNAKKFKRHFTVKKAELTDDSTFVSVSEIKGKRSSTNLLFKIKSNNKKKFDKAKNTIKSWRVTFKKYNFTKDEFNQLLPHKKNLINGLRQNLKDKKEVFVIFDRSHNQVIIMIADYSKTKKFISNFESFCFGKIDSSHEIKTKNELEYELLAYSLNNKDFIQKKKLNSFQIEFRKPMKEQNFNGKFIFKGKKSQLKNVNFQKLQKIFFQHGNFVFNKKDHSFIKNRLDRFRRELKRVFFMLDFEITNENNLEFDILGFDQAQVNQIKVDLVEKFLKKAASTMIQLNPNDDLTKIDQLIKEFINNTDSDDVSSENGEKNSLFNFDMDVEIIFNQPKRMIFLNGVNTDKLNEMRNDLLDKINGSKKCMQCLRYPTLIFISLVKERCLEKIKPKYQGTKILFNRNSVYINGPKDQVENVINELDQICSNLSSQIATLCIQVKKSEFTYLVTRQNDVKLLEKEMNCLVNLSPFERYTFVNMKNKFEIQLIYGDFTKLHVDAYICSINKNLKPSEGLKGGKGIEQEYNKFLGEYGTSKNDGIFVSGSGTLGFKSNSIIVHVIGSEVGFSLEAAKLRYTVKKSLFKIEEKYETSSNNAISIAISPISQTINAAKITIETVTEYLMTQINSKIKNVILISHELETIEEWEKALIDVSMNKGLEINASRNVAGKETFSKNSNQIFFSANKSQIDNIESKIRKIIEEGYVSEKVPYDSISTYQIEELEKEYEAIICKDGDSLIISAIEENLFQLKNKLMDFDLISFDD